MEGFLKYLAFEKKYSDYTISNYELDLKKLEEFLKYRKKDYKNLDYKLVNEFIISLKEQNLSTNSINRILSSSRTYFDYLERIGKIDNNPFKLVRGLKKSKILPNYFKYNDFLVMLDSIDVNTDLGKRNRALFEILLATGARIGEIVNIHLNDIDLINEEIKVLGKGNKERIVYINDCARDALIDYLDCARDNLKKGKSVNDLFLNHLGNKLTERGVRDIIAKIIKKTSLNLKISPHTFRHSFATMLLTEGCDLKSVQELLGHVNMSTTSIYTHLTNEEVKNIYLHTHPRNKK